MIYRDWQLGTIPAIIVLQDKHEPYFAEAPVHLSLSLSLSLSIYIYIYIYRERERERERCPGAGKEKPLDFTNLISTIQNGIRRYLFPHSEEFELAATFSVL
jgi:hypothetical protein